MMTQRGVLSWLAGAILITLSGCNLFARDNYRFKMMVEVETPQGLVTGSSVYSVTAGKRWALTSEEGSRFMEVHGEAAILELPSGPVFVLMQTPKASLDVAFGQMSMAALDPAYRNDWVESTRRIAGSWATLRGEVPRGEWPLMVRFRNVKDPTSVETVDPAAIGVKRIVLERTDEAVTTGLRQKLGWLEGEGRTLDWQSGPTTHPTLAQSLYQGAFSTEIK